MSWLGILMGLLAGVALVMAFLLFIFRKGLQNELSHERWFQRMRNVTGRAPAILIVDLLPGRNIAVGAESFAKDNKLLSYIPDDRYFYLRWKEDEAITPESMTLLALRLRQLHDQLIEAKVDVLYLLWRSGDRERDGRRGILQQQFYRDPVSPRTRFLYQSGSVEAPCIPRRLIFSVRFSFS